MVLPYTLLRCCILLLWRIADVVDESKITTSSSLVRPLRLQVDSPFGPVPRLQGQFCGEIERGLRCVNKMLLPTEAVPEVTTMQEVRGSPQQSMLLSSRAELGSSCLQPCSLHSEV